MAQIAALLAAAMLLLAVLEGLAQGNAGMLARVVLVNLPLAFIATSVAYVVVQLLLVATDGLCHAIASASRDNGEHFFKARDHRPRRSRGGAAGEAVGAGGRRTRWRGRRARRRGRSRCRCSSPSWPRSSAPSPPSSSGSSC